MLALDTWRQQMSLMPWYFWQFAGDPIPITNACSGIEGLTREYAWQSGDSAGRSEVRAALATAEARITAYLGYALMPTNRTATLDVAWPLWSYPQRFTLPYGHVQALGQEVLTLLGEEGVSYDDLDGDGLAETATVIFATTETNADNLVLMVPAADRWDGTEAGERWQLPTSRISISGGVATITLPRWSMARPVLYEGVSGQPLDPTDDTAVLSTVEVYQRSIDTTNALTCSACACSLVSSTNTIDATKATIISDAAGVFDLCPTCLNCGTCEQLTVQYVAGLPRANGRMAEPYATAVARLAAAELAQTICACRDANRELYRWQYDLAQTGANQETYGAVSADDLNNPFGTRRGAVTAWRMLRHQQTPRGLYAG
jgi:hypothetical protein